MGFTPPKNRDMHDRVAAALMGDGQNPDYDESSSPEARIAELERQLAYYTERTNPAVLRERIQERLRRIEADDGDYSITELLADHEQALERLRELSGPCARGGCRFERDCT